MSTPTFDLAAAAVSALERAGFATASGRGARAEIAALHAQPRPSPAGAADLRELPWSSIDNDTSRDLDQIECVEEANGRVRVRVGIADVAEQVGKGSAIDHDAAAQAVTLYTPARIFPMLPAELSTDLTSLVENQTRGVLVVEFHVAADGSMSDGSATEAVAVNRAQLAYGRVGEWLESGSAAADGKIARMPEVAVQLRLQDRVARLLREQRMRLGALEFERPEADPVLVDGRVQLLRAATSNRAMDLIEELMIAANETIARVLREAGRSSLLRVVRSPERWGRIVALAAGLGTTLPEAPSSAALSAFLVARRAADPVHYPDLSLAVIKLMGPGEYVAARAGEPAAEGHFGLATAEYTHATAPNRRFPDLVVQRILKATLRNEPAPYPDEELTAIAAHCNEREGAARKVERAMRKRAVAVSLQSSLGHSYRGVVTGASAKGTYVRIVQPAIEGRITQNERGLDVGDVVTVKLLRADPQLGFIDFARA